MATISRQQYNDLYGPTVGDKIRLGDTQLYVEVEKIFVYTETKSCTEEEKRSGTVWV